MLVAGLAGGLDPAMKAGDVVIYDRCLSTGGDGDLVNSIVCHPKLVEEIESGLLADGLDASRKTGVTAESMITQSTEKIALGARLGAAVVDMESFGLLTSASRTGVPAGVLRVIVDEAGLDTPDFNDALKRDDQLSSWPLARELLRRPEKAVRFIMRLPKAHRTLSKAVHSALFRGLMQAVP
jgi:nucleoside phosphorylase